MSLGKIVTCPLSCLSHHSVCVSRVYVCVCVSVCRRTCVSQRVLCVCARAVTQSCLPLCDPWTAAIKTPVSPGFPEARILGGLILGDLPDLRVKPVCPASPALTGHVLLQPAGPSHALNTHTTCCASCSLRILLSSSRDGLFILLCSVISSYTLISVARCEH